MWICRENVMNMSWICNEHVMNVSRTCHEHVMNMSWTCPKYFVNMSWTCPKYFVNMSWTCRHEKGSLSYLCTLGRDRLNECTLQEPFKWNQLYLVYCMDFKSKHCSLHCTDSWSSWALIGQNHLYAIIVIVLWLVKWPDMKWLRHT